MKKILNLISAQIYALYGNLNTFCCLSLLEWTLDIHETVSTHGWIKIWLTCYINTQLLSLFFDSNNVEEIKRK